MSFKSWFRIFSLLSAILHLGNIRYKRKNRDDSIDICNPEVLPVVSELLEVISSGTIFSSAQLIVLIPTSFTIQRLCFFHLIFWHLQVKEEMLFEALTTRKTVTVGERLIVPYKLSEVRLQLLFPKAETEWCQITGTVLQRLWFSLL